MNDFLILAFIFMAAGVIAVPIASRLQLGSVLGYLLAGIAISPILKVIGVDILAIQHFAEFGVVMMLFLVGLELEPVKLWAMRKRLFLLGGLQVLATTVIITAIALSFGLYWTIALAVGLILALSSTAIVLQTMSEKGLMKSDAGQASFSVLLFQDIAVIPMLALMPLLAMPELMDVAADAYHGSGHDAAGHHGADNEGHHSGGSMIDTLNPIARGAVTLGSIAAIILGGYYLIQPIFKFISSAKLRELHVAAALMIVVGISLLMTWVGLSPALGTFLAGVVLASSAYRHELESDIAPFKGMLLGLFFITVGANINFGLLSEKIALIFALAIGLMALKAIVLFTLSKVFKIEKPENWLFALSLAQAGEFGFVLLSFAVMNQIVPKELSDLLLMVVTLSMLFTPLLFIIYDRIIAPRYSQSIARSADEIDEQNNIIIAGHGRFGGIVNSVLRYSGYSATVIDYSAEQLELIKMFGIKAYYGDATRADLLHAAGIDDAKVFVIALDDKAQITQLVEHVAQHHPHVHIVARAIDRPHVYELWASGCRDIIRETYDSSLRAGRSVLEALGHDREVAEKLVSKMENFDRSTMPEMAGLYKIGVPISENQEFVKRGREISEMFEQGVEKYAKGKSQ